MRRYPSDLTDAEWEIIEPILPIPAVDGQTGKALAPGRHQRHLVRGAYRLRVAVPAGGLPAVADRVRALHPAEQAGCDRADPDPEGGATGRRWEARTRPNPSSNSRLDLTWHNCIVHSAGLRCQAPADGDEKAKASRSATIIHCTLMPPAVRHVR